MHIDPTTALSLSAVARRLPSRMGATVNPSTVSRWVSRGVTAPDGTRVRLAAVRVGGATFVTEQALAEFLEVLNGATGGTAPTAAPRSPSARRKAADAAVRRLSEMGA